MAEAYHTSDRDPSSDHPERRGVSRKRIIAEAKTKVSTIDLADRLGAEQGGRWRKVGAEWVRNCVLNDHEDRTPSFAVNPQKNLWFCHGCLRVGDVITLAKRAWDIDRADVAAAQVLLTFGHEPPPEVTFLVPKATAPAAGQGCYRSGALRAPEAQAVP